MAGPTLPGAVIDVGGDVSGLKKALDDGRTTLSGFERAAQQSLARIDGALGSLNSTLGSLKNSADTFRTVLNFAGAGAAAAALVGAYNQAKTAAKEWADAGAEARQRGVSVEFMGELAFAAENLGTTTKTTAAALETFRKIVADLKDDSSTAAKTLKDLDAPLLETLRNAPNQEAALKAVADAMGRQADQAKNAQIAADLFGKANISMINVLSQGSGGLDTWAEAAHNAGQVMDGETTRAAQNLTRALELLERSPVWLSIEQKLIGLTQNLAVLLGSLQAMTDEQLKGAIGDAETQIEGLNAALAHNAVEGEKSAGATRELVGVFRDLFREMGFEAPAGGALAGNEQIQARIAQLQQFIAQAQSLQTQRASESARSEAVDTFGFGAAAAATAGPSQGLLDQAQRWADELHKRTLSSTQQFFAQIEFERQQDLARLDAYLAKGTISEEAAAAARLDIEKKHDAEIQKLRDKTIQPFTQAIESDLDKAIGDWLKTGKIAWDDLARTILTDLIRIQLRTAILQPLFGGGPEGGTGLVGQALGSLAGVFHAGGVAGGPAPMRLVDARLFSGAPRYHDGGLAGLSPGELPAILKRNEIVLPDQTALRPVGADAGGQGTTVNIINQAGADVQTSTSRDSNGREVLDVVLRAVRDDAARGGLDQALGARFNLNPRLRGGWG